MQKIISLYIYILLFLLPISVLEAQVNPSSHTVSGISKKRLERYERFLEQEIMDKKIPGAVSLIYRNGTVVHDKAFGYCDVASKDSMKMDQIFFIQSMTKPIISVAIMMLYEEGYFQLTDPVSRYLPAFKTFSVAKDPSKGLSGGTEEADSPISIWNLLTHTSGLSHGLTGSKLDQELRQKVYQQSFEHIRERVNFYPELPLVGHPGAQWVYSVSPDVLSALIEHFSGMTTAEFLQKRLFDPLGMKDTGYNLSKEQQARMVQLHTYNGQGVIIKSPRQTPMEGNTVYGGAAGLFSTATDYLKFCQMLLNGGEYKGQRLLSPKTVELMTTDQVGELYPYEGQGFGLGFGIVTDMGQLKALGSPGQYSWGGAYCTYFFVDPKEDLIAILMTQVFPYQLYYTNMLRQFVYQAIVD